MNGSKQRKYRSKPTPERAGSLIQVGEVVGAHGLDGGLKVWPSSDFVAEWPNRLRTVAVDAWGMRQVGVRSVGWTGRTPVICLEGVNTREAAEALAHAKLFVDETALPGLPDGQYYWHELVGLVTLDPKGNELGPVRHVTRAGPHEILEIDGRDGSWLVPFVRAWVTVDDGPPRVLRLRQDPRDAD